MRSERCYTIFGLARLVPRLAEDEKLLRPLTRVRDRLLGVTPDSTTGHRLAMPPRIPAPQGLLSLTRKMLLEVAHCVPNSLTRT